MDGVMAPCEGGFMLVWERVWIVAYEGNWIEVPKCGLREWGGGKGGVCIFNELFVVDDGTWEWDDDEMNGLLLHPRTLVILPRSLLIIYNGKNTKLVLQHDHMYSIMKRAN